jgi:3-methylcrotonyl-CoA carboxylase alpha subunit
VITSAYFQAGDQVKAGDELVEFQALAEEVA